MVALARGFLLRREDYAQMAQHVQTAAPLEACGLIAGQAGRSVAVYPIPNVLASPSRFRMAPEAQWQALYAIEQQGWDLLGIYHSHPQGPPSPSEVDARELTYPEVFHLIWAPLGAVWVCRAFFWTPQGFTEAPLRLE